LCPSTGTCWNISHDGLAIPLLPRGAKLEVLIVEHVRGLLMTRTG
jgi:hypothetical protein